ncbi:regulation of response to stimulus [Branchiostoma belcheri]|nr:regulation of response to stimulus [Branchiostoma belcheri]
MRANNRCRLIHRDCWPFSELFLPRRSTPATQSCGGRGGRPPEPVCQPGGCLLALTGGRRPGGPGPREDACILCTSQLQQQSVLNLNNSSQHTSTCLPNNYRVAVRGFSFGILSVQKLRPSQKKSKVSELALIECGITDVEQDLLAEFPKLQTLRLDYNNLTYVKQNWFSVNNTESDIKPAQNITHLCQQAWENVSTVRVGLRGDITLQIVPMGLDRSCHPQTVAIVISNVISKENRTRLYDHEEMTNVTCLVNTWEEETYQHVFTAPLSSTPDGTVCPRKTQATRTPDSTLFTREGMPLTTIDPKITTTKRQRCCTATQEPPPAAPFPNCWMMGGPGPLAGAHGTTPNRTTQQSGKQQYSEIPDEYYNQQNTATSTTSQTDHDYSQIPDEYYNYYNTIPDEYYNRYNTYPPTRRVPQDDKDYSVRFNTAAAEVVLPSSTRLGDKHPSYNTAPQVWRDPQNYQIPAQGRNTNIRSHRIPQTGNSGHQYMGLIGNCRYNRRPLSYPQTLCVPQDDKDYSVRLNTAAAEVVLPSSTRLGDKHPSYDTAPQVWRDPQNYQIPTRGRNTNIRSHRIQQTGNNGHQYMGLLGKYRHSRRRLSYPQTLCCVPQDDKDYSINVRFNTAAAEVVLPSSTRLGAKHPSYNTAPQVWRDPQNYQIPAQGRLDVECCPGLIAAVQLALSCGSAF